MDKTAADMMVKARINLLIMQPFFGTLAMRLKLVEDTAIKTLNVNGQVVRYNPTFVKGLTHELTKSALAHEVMHCVLKHCGANGRGLSLNPKKWNYATDYAVNGILKEAGFELGDSWLHDPQYKDKSAEQIYNMIPDPPEDDSGGGGGGGPQDELSPGDPDPAVQAQQDVDWQIATTQAATAAKAAGKLSSALDQFVENLKKPKVDWRSELRQFITRIAKNDYAWQRPNRKMLAAGYILPGLFSEEMGKIVVCSDESGSVDPQIMSAFEAEIRAIKDDLRPESTVLLHFDTDVGKVEEFAPDDEFKMKRFCGGGTDFRPVLEKAEEFNPMCTIVLTDLYGPFPASPPDMPVLWVSVSGQKAPFGDTLHIEV